LGDRRSVEGSSSRAGMVSPFSACSVSAHGR
jgi:hypothetical protein